MYVKEMEGAAPGQTSHLPWPMQEQFTNSSQGQSAGPVDEGKIPNIYSCIICDPDKNDADGRLMECFRLLCCELQHLEMMMG